MLNFIKQFFCKHDFIIENFYRNGFFVRIEFTLKICRKCDYKKRKVKWYLFNKEVNMAEVFLIDKSTGKERFIGYCNDMNYIDSEIKNNLPVIPTDVKIIDYDKKIFSFTMNMPSIQYYRLMIKFLNIKLPRKLKKKIYGTRSRRRKERLI